MKKEGGIQPPLRGVGLDKFARLAALKPARVMPQREVKLRDPDDTDLVGRLLGAGIARNDFGEHLAIRNWYSTPEFSQPSEVALDLLSRVSGLKKQAPTIERAPFSKRSAGKCQFENTHGPGKSRKNGCFSIRRPPGLPAERARTHFWWGWHGGMRAACRWSNYFCAIFPKSIRCCTNCRCAWRNDRCW